VELVGVLALSVNVALAEMNEDLIAAAKRGDLPELQRLLAQRAEVNAKNKEGKTALMYASEKGHQEVRELLIKSGAKWWAVREDGSGDDLNGAAGDNQKRWKTHDGSNATQHFPILDKIAIAVYPLPISEQIKRPLPDEGEVVKTAIY
jgi:ankyrin repeat protein